MENKLLGKTLAIGILILFVGATVPSISAETNKAASMTTMVDWSDNFDSYTLGQFLDGTPDDGGWEGWDDDPAWGSYVVDTMARSAPHSVEIVGDSDTIHQFEGIDSGQWIFTAYQYINETTYTGETYFIMLNTYNHGSPYHWSTQIHFYNDEVISDAGGQLPIIYDEWVEIRNEIDLDEDTQTTYYGDVLLTEASWSEGVSGPGGVTNISCVDLFANNAAAVWYDDISLVEVIPGEEPELEVSDIAGGFGVSAKINNVGDAEATDTEWSITLDGGLIILGKETTGTIASIPAGESADIKSGLIFGIGRPTITVTAECAEGSSDEGTASGLVILFFVLGVS